LGVPSGGLGAVVTAFNIVDIAVIFGTLLQNKDIIISPQSEVIFVMADPILNTMQGVSAVLIFILLWGATILLLYHNLQKVGKVKFWTLITTPLIFFSSFYVSYFGVLNFGPPEDPANIVIPVLAILTSTIAGLVLFGLAFHSVARSLGSSQVKDFMTITGYGFILFFTASNTTLAGAGYPPFGFVNVLLVGPLSFLILAGLYRSAVTVAQDAKLRQSLRISLRKEVKLLDSIARSEMQKEVENKVFTAVKKNADILEHQSGIEPSLTVEEMHELVESTMKAIRKDDKQTPY
jgi:divalent metal cation (Fe/Co/Zn/Cd) transporter